MRSIFLWLLQLDQSKFVRMIFERMVNFGLPLVLCLVSVGFGVEVKNDALPLIISVFSIISALLFGALFSIFSVVSSIDRSKLAREFRNLAPFKRQLRSVNRTVVYLVGQSSVAVCVTLSFYFLELSVSFESAVLIFLVTHFFAVFFPLLMRIFHILELGYRKI